MRSCAGTADDGREPRRACPATATPRSSAASTRPRRSTCASTRSARSPRSTACRRRRGCRSVGRSTRTGAAPMLAPTAHGATRRSSWPTADAAAGGLRVGDGSRDRAPRQLPPLRRDRGARPLVDASSPRTGSRSRTARELVASGDHRFLTDRGWKYVTGAEHGPDQRPHLTMNNALLGTGRFARAAATIADYRRGYLCGMIRGDGTSRTYSLRAAAGGHGDVHRFRLALARRRGAATARGATSLRQASRPTSSSSSGDRRRAPADAGRSGPRRAPTVERIRELIRWPLSPDRRLAQGVPRRDLRCRGLAAAASLRIANSDGAIIDWTTPACGTSASTPSSRTARRRERRAVRPPPRWAARAPALLPPVDPAITRKRTIDGHGAEVRRADARGRPIEPLGHGDAALRHHDRHGRLHRQRRRQPQLLRPPDPQVPRLRRRAGLRARDRRQGQRARGAAGRAGAAVVEGRARRAGDEHRPVPVGRGALQAHAAGSGRRCATRERRARCSPSRRCCCATSS